MSHDAWLDKFFQSYYRHRPVNATFTGVHAYDDRLPDYSESGVADVVTGMTGLLERLKTEDQRLKTEDQRLKTEDQRLKTKDSNPQSLVFSLQSLVFNHQSSVSSLQSSVFSLDSRLALGYLRIQLAEFESGWFYRKNPCVYTGEAIFGVIALFLRDFAPLEQRVEAAIARLRAIPRLLAQGRQNIQSAPLEWTRKAIRECHGAREFLTHGINTLLSSFGRHPDGGGVSSEKPYRGDASPGLGMTVGRHPDGGGVSSEKPQRGDASPGLGMTVGRHPDEGGVSSEKPQRGDASPGLGMTVGRHPDEGGVSSEKPYRGDASPGLGMINEGLTTALRAAADMALAAFTEFETYLTHELMTRPDETYACGQAMFDLLMREGHCLDMDTEAVRVYAERRFAEIRDSLDQAAYRLRPDGDWQVILAGLADDHPTADGYLDRFHAIWNASYQSAHDHALVTWPDYPLQYIEVPAMFRAAAPHLYFLPYRSPATYDPHEVYHYLVPPISGLSPDEQRSRLRGVNASVIKLNHVVHHGAIGHHVQNWYAYRSASRIGQVAAIDCALRIGMFCGGTLAEGWACYVTDLMDEVGFYTPAEAFAQQHSTLRQAARAVVDTNLHLGRFSLDDATRFYTHQVGMAAEAARAEAVKNSMFPGAAMMYLVGTDMVHDLRRQVASREGAAFSLRRFHDRFLSYGAIPVSLIAQELLRG